MERKRRGAISKTGSNISLLLPQNVGEDRLLTRRNIRGFWGNARLEHKHLATKDEESGESAKKLKNAFRAVRLGFQDLKREEQVVKALTARKGVKKNWRRASQHARVITTAAHFMHPADNRIQELEEQFHDAMVEVQQKDADLTSKIYDVLPDYSDDFDMNEVKRKLTVLGERYADSLALLEGIAKLLEEMSFLSAGKWEFGPTINQLPSSLCNPKPRNRNPSPRYNPDDQQWISKQSRATCPQAVMHEFPDVPDIPTSFEMARSMTESPRDEELFKYTESVLQNDMVAQVSSRAKWSAKLRPNLRSFVALRKRNKEMDTASEGNGEEGSQAVSIVCARRFTNLSGSSGIADAGCVKENVYAYVSENFEYIAEKRRKRKKKKKKQSTRKPWQRAEIGASVVAAGWSRKENNTTEDTWRWTPSIFEVSQEALLTQKFWNKVENMVTKDDGHRSCHGGIAKPKDKAGLEAVLLHRHRGEGVVEVPHGNESVQPSCPETPPRAGMQRPSPWANTVSIVEQGSVPRAQTAGISCRPTSVPEDRPATVGVFGNFPKKNGQALRQAMTYQPRAVREQSLHR